MGIDVDAVGAFERKGCFRSCGSPELREQALQAVGFCLDAADIGVSMGSPDLVKRAHRVLDKLCDQTMKGFGPKGIAKLCEGRSIEGGETIDAGCTGIEKFRDLFGSGRDHLVLLFCSQGNIRVLICWPREAADIDDAVQGACSNLTIGYSAAGTAPDTGCR